MTNPTDCLLADRWEEAQRFERVLSDVVLGQAEAIHLIATSVFARGHALLEGGVGVGKTTLLRAVASALGGAYERVEGAIDLLPADLIYHTHLDEKGRPAVAPGPLIRSGDRLCTFFFNEINRARPQVHALLLRVMAERSLSAFNRDFRFPHLQVFADRNRVEREETFELPAAARDRFMLEIRVPAPEDPEVIEQLVFDPRYHDVDRLLGAVVQGTLSYAGLNDTAEAIQRETLTSPTLKTYVRDLCQACHTPALFGIRVLDAPVAEFIEAGPSPRGMSLLVRAARVHAWLGRRSHVLPEDVQAVFSAAISHRIYLRPAYEYRRAELIPELVDRVLKSIAAP